jgi:hypothetical protein
LDSFYRAVLELDSALRMDLSWLKYRRYIAQHAEDWEQRHRSKDLLLRGTALQEATQWLNGAPDGVRIPDLVVPYLDAGREAWHRHLNELEQLKQREIASLYREKGRRPLSYDDPKPRGNTIFVSYRRADSSHAAGRIFDALSVKYGEDRLLFDVDTIPIGADFHQHIMRYLIECGVVLVVIGPNWARRRESLFKGNKEQIDYVETEVRAAIELQLPIIPVLIDGAKIPSRSALPKPMKALTKINGLPLGHGRDFHLKLDMVIDRIDQVLSSAD